MPQKKGARRTKKARNVLADKVATGDVRTGPVVPIVEERVTFYDKLVQPVQAHCVKAANSALHTSHLQVDRQIRGD